MSSSNQKTAIFPLGTALFPGNRLQLQIFEQRYLDLITHSLKTGQGFVIAPIREGNEVGQPATIFPCGVLVSIIDWTQQPNGLLGITIEADQRVLISNTSIDDNQLMYGDIELAEETDSALARDSVPKWLELLEKMAETGQWGDNPDFSDITLGELTWLIAGAMVKHAHTGADLLLTEQPEIRLKKLQQIMGDFLSSQPDQ